MKADAVHFLLGTPKGRLILALAVMLISWVWLFSQFSGDFRGVLPSASDIARLKEDVEKEKAEFAVLDRKARSLAKIRSAYDKRLAGFWDEEQEGDVSLGFRELVEQAANLQEIKLTSLGSARTTRINGNLSFAELEVSFSGTLDEIARFLAAIRALPHSPAWKRADFRQEAPRPDRMAAASAAGRNGTMPGTAVQPARRTNVAMAEPDTELKLRFSGTLRIICRNAPESKQEETIR